MYKIIFTDKTEFLGGDIHNSKWNEIPDKPIKQLDYTFNDKIIFLKNFEAYNHIIEKVGFFSGTSINTKIMLMGKREQEVNIVTIDLKTNQITESLAIFGQEYYSKPTTGWKKGIDNVEID